MRQMVGEIDHDPLCSLLTEATLEVSHDLGLKRRSINGKVVIMMVFLLNAITLHDVNVQYDFVSRQLAD